MPLIYSSEKFCKAHTAPFIGWHYDLYYRDAICSECGAIIGEQTKTLPFEKEFCFYPHHEKDEYKFCPYCGSPLYKEK